MEAEDKKKKKRNKKKKNKAADDVPVTENDQVSSAAADTNSDGAQISSNGQLSKATDNGVQYVDVNPNRHESNGSERVS